MRGVGRALFLLAVAGFFIWLFNVQRPDRPTAVHTPPAPQGGPSGEAAPVQPWTQEDRVQWRETVDRRLMR